MHIISEVNDRLKQARVKVKILQRGESLYLQATLPPKVGESKNKQRQIALGVPCSVEGLRVAEAKAFELSSQLVMGRFEWSQWEKIEGKVGDRWIVKHAIDGFRKYYQSTNSLSDDSWDRFYWMPVFRALPPDAELTEALVLATVLTMPKNSWKRNQACMALPKLCKWAGFEISLSKYRGKVRKREINPPEKSVVEEYYSKIDDPRWQRIYARIAIFGLRPHEAFFWESRGECKGYVTRGKTGAREVLAVFPEWAKAWELEGEIPDISRHKTYAKIGKHLRESLLKYKLPFSPYELRHAAAIEFSVVRGAPIKLAALNFGHSEDIHLKTYTKWLDSSHLKAAYDRIMKD